MTNWQPIETAPKDGRLVQLYALHSMVPTLQLARWRAEEAPFIAGWWFHSSIYRDEMLLWTPTHWAPFIAPDAAAKDQANG
jgi:hypothetical protein